METIRIHEIKTSGQPEFPPVIVGGYTLPDTEIAAELQYHPAEDLKEAWQAAAKSLVVKTLLEQRAKALGIQANSEEERTALLLEQELQVPDPTEEQCRHYFESNRKRFQTPILLAVSHILLPAAPDDIQARDQQRTIADQLLKALEADPASFAALAKQHSACNSAAQGGSLGQLSKGQTVAEFEQQVWSMAEGICTYPVESRYGFHLVKVDQRVEGKPLEYTYVATQIRQYLHEQSTRRALSQYLQILGTETGVQGVDFKPSGSHLLQ